MKKWKKVIAALTAGVISLAGFPQMSGTFAGWCDADTQESDAAAEAYDDDESGETLSVGSVSLTEEELQAANYEVTLPISVNFDLATIDMGFHLSDGLTYVRAESTTKASAVASCEKNFVWMPYSCNNNVSAGQIAAIKVRLPENTSAGEIFSIIPTMEDARGIHYTAGQFDAEGRLITLEIDSLKTGYISITDAEVTATSAAETTTAETTATTTTSQGEKRMLYVGSADITLDELKAAGYRITLPVYANFEMAAIDMGFQLSDGLTYVKARSTTKAIAAASSFNSFVWMTYSNTSKGNLPGGQIAEITVQLPENAAGGSSYSITPTMENAKGVPSYAEIYLDGEFVSAAVGILETGKINIFGPAQSETTVTGTGEATTTTTVTAMPEKGNALSVGSIDLTLDELKAANYEVTLPIRVNFDLCAIDMGMWLSDDLTFVDAKSVTGASCFGASSNSFVWISYAYGSENLPAGQIAEITVRLPEAVTGGEVYSITPTMEDYRGRHNTAIQYVYGENVAVEVESFETGYISIKDDTSSTSETTVTETTATTTTEVTTTEVTVTTTTKATTTTQEKKNALSVGSIDLTLDELKAANYEVTLPIRVNFDLCAIGMGMQLSDGLSYVNARSTTKATCFPESSDSFVWMPYSYGNVSCDNIPAGTIAEITVKLPETVTGGEVYSVTPVLKDESAARFDDTDNIAAIELNSFETGFITIADTEPSAAIYGDINLDSRTDITDAVLLNKAVSGAVALDSAALKNADCDGNGELGASDATVLLQFLAHLIDTLPYQA